MPQSGCVNSEPMWSFEPSGTPRTSSSARPMTTSSGFAYSMVSHLLSLLDCGGAPPVPSCEPVFEDQRALNLSAGLAACMSDVVEGLGQTGAIEPTAPNDLELVGRRQGGQRATH